jgi:hypothetical protein
MSLDKSNFSCFPFNHFAILWVVNQSGEVLIAIEEGIVAKDGNSIVFPLPKAVALAYSKLGHPTLVGCQPARIGGEIFCDLGEDMWYINNKSGRYGVNLGRTPQQLENVAAMFAQFGIRLRTVFYE